MSLMETLCEMIATMLDMDTPDTIQPSTRFQEDLGMSIVDVSAMMFEMNQYFHLEMDDSPQTVGDLRECIVRAQKARRPNPVFYEASKSVNPEASKDDAEE
ncbi:hypothetical protein A4U49_05985 [Acidithiobacillus ferrivorans]|uniref:acyl carrier protein n=1 Tax=Acidithiobacillus ferrivorans TaxID=160808 RepID=UPI000892C6B0|nr:hypothetical protein [Acidithiobacillus ferrivorans]OFA16727.1 hypothetical protein A4U49_05985 [Acidithiobacillus ferrivorans]